MTSIVISGTGLFTPSESISNEELVATFNQYVANYNREHQTEIAAGTVTPLLESSSEFIVKASGIKSRYVLNKSGILDAKVMHPLIADRPDDVLSVQAEMAVPAVQDALLQADKNVADVDALLVACSNMQRAYPAIAIEIQHELGMQGFAYDMNVACSSATFAIQTAVDAIRSGSANCVVVVNPEICSAHLEWRDRDCHFIFGDVCTAIVLEREETCQSNDSFEILHTKLRTKFSSNIRNNFGFLNRCDPSTIGARDKTFRQNGRKVFKEVIPLVVEIILSQLHENEILPQQIKRMWLHQANLNMNQLIAKKVMKRDISEIEAPVVLDEYANTSSAGSIIAFHRYRGDLDPGDMGLICSFGSGYSVGSIIVKKR